MATDNKLLFFKSLTCPKCPTMEKITEQVASNLDLGMEVFIAGEIPQQVTNDLNRDNITITAAPSIVLKEGNRLYPVTFGDLIPSQKLQQKVELLINGNGKLETVSSTTSRSNTSLSIGDFLPDVRTTKGDLEKFNQEKILRSIVKETNLSENVAQKVMQQVIKHILSSNMQWLSGPSIRELCCAEMAMMGLDEARKRYTRIGMPLMDYEDLLNLGIFENSNQYNNPESIHSWAADRISEEYALLRLVPEVESKAHLRGDIHIHMLRYFDLRPFCQEVDPRIILKYGLPPTMWRHSAVSKPANGAIVAATHLAKWLGILQGEFSLPYCETVLIEENGLLKWREIGAVVEENTPHLKPIYTFSFDPQTLQIHKQVITGVYKHQCKEPIIRIHTEYGRAISVTAHHSLFTLHNGQIVPVKGKELQVGDYIITPKRIRYDKPIKSLNAIDLIFEHSSHLQRWYVRGAKVFLTSNQLTHLGQIDAYASKHLYNDSIPLKTFKQLEVSNEYLDRIRIGTIKSPHNLPALIPITEEFLFLLGIYAAEGSSSYKKFNLSFGSHEADLIEKVKESFCRTFGTELRERHPHVSAIQLVVESDLFHELFTEIFQCGTNSYNKRVAPFIFGLQERYVIAFLYGYFIGDGHRVKFDTTHKRGENTIVAKTASGQLANELNFLCLRVGILPALTRDKHMSILSIYGKQYLDILLDPFQNHEQYQKNRGMARITIPTKQTIAPLQIPVNHCGLRSKLDSIPNLTPSERACLRQKDRIGIQRAKRILSKMPSNSYTNNLEKYIDGDLTVLQIKKIELLPPEEFVYDFEVKPNGKPIENFVAGTGLIMAHNSGGLGYDLFTVFLAPYVRGLPYKARFRNDVSVFQVAQCFLYESNQIFAARGAQVPFTSITCTPTVPKALLNVPAVSYGGKYDGVYGDYVEECRQLFRAFAEVYTAGDATGKPFNFPKHEIKVKKEWLEKFKDEYALIAKETAKFGTPYFLNMCAEWLPDEVHSQCCRIILDHASLIELGVDPSIFDWAQSYMNLGSLQSVSINLPRCAYEAHQNDDRLFEVIHDRLELARSVLLIKYNLVKKTLKANLLPMSAIQIEGTPLLDFRKQSLSIGFIGLNECVKFHMGKELHESNQAYEFGKKILHCLADTCKEFSQTTGIHFALWEQPAESAAERFAKLDLEHYPNQALVLGNKDTRSVYYTNSGHFNYAADIPLLELIQKQGEYHPIIRGGVITHIWLGEAQPDPEGLWKFTQNICLHTKNAYFAFTKDFSQCVSCNRVTMGIINSCPHCHAPEDQIEWWSRVTGYYSRVKRYNKGKFAEWQTRKHHTLS